MLEPGAVIADRYRVGERVGSGGMGAVYLAHDRKLDRVVALKVVRAERLDGRTGRERMLREARSAARLDHPGIVEVYDVGETEDGGAFLVMERVKGRTLRAVLRAGMEPDEVLRVVSETADALYAAHREGVVHRDVKPDNIMLRDDGRIVLVDFGLVKRIAAPLVTPGATGPSPLLVPESVDPLTDSGSFVGTPAYLAPEQARGRETEATDQWALALTAYELLCGALPWESTSPAHLLAQVLMDRPPRLSTRCDVPEAVDFVLARALEKDPGNRFPDVQLFASALHEAFEQPQPLSGDSLVVKAESAQSGLVEAVKGAKGRVGGGWSLRRISSWAVAGVVGCMLLLGSAVSLWQGPRLTGDARAAEPPTQRSSSGPRFVGAGADVPQQGGTFRGWHVEPPRGLDPMTAFDSVSFMSLKLLFDGLLDYDHERNLVPMLATSLPDASDDGRTLTFHLRAGVRFHNGRVLTADDVRWSIERMLHPATASPGADFYVSLEGWEAYRDGHAAHVRGIEVIGPTTIAFHLVQIDPTFLHAMAMTFAAPVPRENYPDAEGSSPSLPIGTGAFVMREAWSDSSEVLVLERNPDYWRAGRPYLDRIELSFDVDREGAFPRFLRGELDHLHRVSLVDWPTIAEEESWAPHVSQTPKLVIWGIVMNCEQAPFDDVHVRRAVAFALDRERLVSLRHGRILPLGQAIPEGIPGHDAQLPERQRLDLDRAREEMRLAGHPDGLGEPVEVLFGEGPRSAAYGEWLRTELANIGIEVQVVQAPFAEVLRRSAAGSTQALLAGWNMDFPDGASFLPALFHSRVGTETRSEYHAFYRNELVDDLLDRAAREIYPSRRRELFREVNAHVSRDAPWAFMFSDRRTEAWQPYVRGYRPHPVWDNLYRDVWLDLPRRPSPR